MAFSQIQEFLFYLIIFLIPVNLAKHWPQKWSYVNGILVDYLIPSLYLTDILILLLLGLWLIEKIRFKKKLKDKKLLYGYIVILSYCLGSAFLAQNRLAAFYKLLKLTEISFFIFYIKNHISLKKDIKKIGSVLAFSVIWQSILALAQWFNQGSIFGYWFLGEQPYNSSTLGIKTVSFFGRIKVPPLGTFPHPNLLAAFLSLFFLFILSPLTKPRGLVKSSKTEVATKPRGLVGLAVALGIIALLLTFSLPVYLATAFFLGQLTIKGLKKRLTSRPPSFTKLKPFFIFALCSFILALFFYSQLVSPSSVSRRIELIKISLKMWLSSPLWGIGLNNFVVRMEEFGQVTANYRFLQPVHNIYLLILSETGLIGLGLILAGFYFLILNQSKHFPSALCSLFSILFLSLFDHYFLTIQQGMLILGLVLGLTLTND